MKQVFFITTTEIMRQFIVCQNITILNGRVMFSCSPDGVIFEVQQKDLMYLDNFTNNEGWMKKEYGVYKA